jgi:hypothetical protein
MSGRSLSPSRHTAIDLHPHQATGQRRAQQQMVDAQAGIPGESISEMAPASASAQRW